MLVSGSGRRAWCVWATSPRRWPGIAATGGVWRGTSRPVACEEFSLDVAMAWVDEACGGFFEKEQAGTLKQTDVYLFRVAAMLGDFAGAWGGAAPLLPEREQAERRGGRGPCPVSGVAAGRGLRSVDGPGVWHGGRGVPRVHWHARRGGRAGRRGDRRVRRRRWPATRPRRSSRSCARCARFCGSPPPSGLIDAGVLDAVPAVRSSKQARIPSVWDPADVARILEAIDRGNPSGKRDYAIVLLVCRLGLRGIDVKRLEFADLGLAGQPAVRGAGQDRPAGRGCRC